MVSTSPSNIGTDDCGRLKLKCTRHLLKCSKFHARLSISKKLKTMDKRKRTDKIQS